ncbi:MAG TPA: 4Fe-4S binding protein [Firmicutes bacterium]|nr:4Fe-4S binding protein [Bacillota bacterium]
MQLLIVSGKGGTGKTTLAATFAQLATSQLIIDCDVEASNLHLLLARAEESRQPFSGAKIATALENACIMCGKCTSVCRFGAIQKGEVDWRRCEGCGACVYICPAEHLALSETITGETIVSATDFGLLSRAEMEPGAEGSGKLVTEIRRRGELAAKSAAHTLLDGPPGIGCAVIASMTGCQMALVVAEASLSGLKDAERIIDLLQQMRVVTSLCINRADVSPELTARLERLCADKTIPLMGKIPYDPVVQIAQRRGHSLLDYPDSPATKAVLAVWEQLQMKMGVNGNEDCCTSR